MTSGLILAFVSACWATGAAAAEDIDVVPRPLPRIPAGTVIGDEKCNGWTNIVLVAQSRVTRGDVDEVSPLVGRFAAMFKLAILANVGSQRKGDQVSYSLDKVAVGNAMDIGGKTTVVTGDAHKSLNAGLGLIGSQVLSSAEQSLERAQQVARTRTLLVFDADGIVLSGGEHREMVLRHVIWVDSRTGRLGTVVWLLRKDDRGGYVAAHDYCVFLPPNLREDRDLHVDADKFLLGIPGADALAIVRLPPGKTYEFHPELRGVAETARFTPGAVRRLAAELSAAFSASRSR